MELNIFSFSSGNIRFSTKPYAYLVRTLREEVDRARRQSRESVIIRAEEELAKYESLENITNSVDFKGAYNTKHVTVSEQVSASVYVISVIGTSSEGYINARYRFDKTGESTLGYALYVNGMSTGPIELVR